MCWRPHEFNTFMLCTITDPVALDYSMAAWTAQWLALIETALWYANVLDACILFLTFSLFLITQNLSYRKACKGMVSVIVSNPPSYIMHYLARRLVAEKQ
jgi:hypothetical protein